MKVLYNDLITEAVISNEQDIITAPGHPIENIKDDRLVHNAWISYGGYYGSMYNDSLNNQDLYTGFKDSEGVFIDFDLGGIYSFDAFALAGNNFRNIDYTITWSATDIDTPDGTRIYTYGGEEWTSMFLLTGGEVQARYVRLQIKDANPTDQYLHIGKISLGLADTLPYFSGVYDVEHISNANRVISPTRQLYGGPVAIYRRVSITFPNINNQSALLTYFKGVDLYTPFFVQFDSDCPIDEGTMYSTLAEDSLPFNYNGTFYTSRLTFMEVF